MKTLYYTTLHSEALQGHSVYAIGQSEPVLYFNADSD